uniref:CCAAT/enhancer-binding protein gamma n=1 Tax=Scleropages formosus TaxID=113540 RepID=A0A8C9V2I1_SCLFO
VSSGKHPVVTMDRSGVSVIQTQGNGSTGLQQVPQVVPSGARGGGKATPPSKAKRSAADKESEEYRQRRERNNLAVKKSRMRSKQKALDTQQRVNELKEENERLEAKIRLLSKELSVLKDLFLEHAHNMADSVQPLSAEGPGPRSQSGNHNGGGSSQ